MRTHSLYCIVRRLGPECCYTRQETIMRFSFLDSRSNELVPHVSIAFFQNSLYPMRGACRLLLTPPIKPPRSRHRTPQIRHRESNHKDECASCEPSLHSTYQHTYINIFMPKHSLLCQQKKFIFFPPSTLSHLLLDTHRHTYPNQPHHPPRQRIRQRRRNRRQQPHNTKRNTKHL